MRRSCRKSREDRSACARRVVSVGRLAVRRAAAPGYRSGLAAERLDPVIGKVLPVTRIARQAPALATLGRLEGEPPTLEITGVGPRARPGAELLRRYFPHVPHPAVGVDEVTDPFGLVGGRGDGGGRPFRIGRAR